MKTSNEEHSEESFSIDLIPSLRESLPVSQQNILDNVWEQYLFFNKDYPIRGLPKLIGKQKISDALKGIDKVYINEVESSSNRVLKLNVLGALLSVKGLNLANLLLRLLDFIREEYIKDPLLSNITSATLQEQLKLTETQVIALFKLISLYGLYNVAFSLSGWSSPKDWSINISDEIIEFWNFSDSKVYLSTRLTEFHTLLISQLNNPAKATVMDYFESSDANENINNVSMKEQTFISHTRVQALKELKNTSYDCTRLVCLCTEINDCASRNNIYAVAVLTRTIIDHIPPIFGFKSFAEVASNYGGGGKSFRLSSDHLNKQMRFVADKFLHMQIRDKEVMPDMHEVNFSRELETILAEVCRLLKS
ncbi:hypothetical protein GALL_62170 [mine drainage metagenome]|uniref:Uncharacterized protein n=1 Tax=mine drainage metagenome TaxID=410659 RepID=A0A1J5TKH5_9ZZZZ